MKKKIIICIKCTSFPIIWWGIPYCRNIAESIKQPGIQQMHMETGSNILQQQFDELKEYSRYLEKEVEEYKKYIEERFKNK